MAARTLGVLGGMGAEATARFFQQVVGATPARSDSEHIETIIHNNVRIPDRTAYILGKGPSPLPELLRSLELLTGAGAAVIAVPCMTSHYFFEDLQESSRVPVLHAIDEAARAVLALPERPDTVGVLATTGCLVAGMFQASLERFGLKCVIPDDGAQESEVMEAIYGQKGIKAGHTDSRNRRLLVGVAETLVAGGAGAIIGGCTEVPLVVGAGDLEVPFIDTLDVLARAAVRYCRGS